MYKPTDIVAVYGEVRGGGQLVHEDHQIIGLEDKRHSEPAICEVVRIHENNLEVKNKSGRLAIVAKGQCRLVKRDGKVVDSHKAQYSVKVFNSEYGTYHNHHEDTFSTLQEARSFISDAISVMEAEQEDYNEDDTSIEIRKFIDISDEV